MGRHDSQFEKQRNADSKTSGDQVFEIFVSAGFSGFELTSITQTLASANKIAPNVSFEWRFVSDEPGFVQSGDGVFVRAEPAIDNHAFADFMIVVGGSMGVPWLPRARSMQRKGLTVALLSDAATNYIKSTKAPPGQVTTHWKDVTTLNETGYYPNLTSNLSENSDGIITAAGAGSTQELVIGLISSRLEASQIADLSRQLLLQTIRKSDAEQPKDLSDNSSLFDHRVTAAIKLMEESIAEPMSMAELTERVGLSTRHLERVFRSVFDDTPARFYKRLRTKRARVMIEETLMPMIDVAIATGFGSCNTLARAVKEEYGLTPSKMRSRQKIHLLKYEHRRP